MEGNPFNHIEDEEDKPKAKKTESFHDAINEAVFEAPVEKEEPDLGFLEALNNLDLVEVAKVEKEKSDEEEEDTKEDYDHEETPVEKVEDTDYLEKLTVETEDNPDTEVSDTEPEEIDHSTEEELEVPESEQGAEIEESTPEEYDIENPEDLEESEEEAEPDEPEESEDDAPQGNGFRQQPQQQHQAGETVLDSQEDDPVTSYGTSYVYTPPTTSASATHTGASRTAGTGGAATGFGGAAHAAAHTAAGAGGAAATTGGGATGATPGGRGAPPIAGGNLPPGTYAPGAPVPTMEANNNYATRQEAAGYALLTGAGALVGAEFLSRRRDKKIEKKTEKHFKAQEKKIDKQKEELEEHQERLQRQVQEHQAELERHKKIEKPQPRRDEREQTSVGVPKRAATVDRAPHPQPLRETYSPDVHDRVPPKVAFEQLTGIEQPKYRSLEQERRHEVKDDPSKTPVSYAQPDLTSPWQQTTKQQSQTTTTPVDPTPTISAAPAPSKPTSAMHDTYKNAAISGIVTAAVILAIILIIFVLF